MLIDSEQEYKSSLEEDASSLELLSHTSIRKVYGTGKTGQFNYLSMQYYPMGSMRELIIDGPLSIQEVLGLASQIANALEYLHSKGIVHRDLKPTNILVDVKRRIYLTDFGLAKPLSQTTQMIHTGHGTAPYSPPEQHTKTLIRQESDIYSFGILLYEMFTGTLPWGGTSALALKQLESGEQIPDPCDISPRLPKGLVHALRILTHIDPDRRPSSALTAFGLIVASLRDLEFDSLSFTFGREAVSQVLRTVPKVESENAWAVEEASYIYERFVQYWEPGREQFKLGLTNFAFMNAAFSKQQNGDLTSDLRMFMALTHGVNQIFWWGGLGKSSTKTKVIENVIATEEPEVVERMLTLLVSQPDQLVDFKQLSPLTISKLIELGMEAPIPALRSKALEFLGLVVGQKSKWENIHFSASDDTDIAALALLQR
jgi:serine/threonine protein kinase